MYADEFLVVGLVMGLLAIPALLNAYVEGRVPRLAAIMVMLSIALIALAVYQKPSGYKIEQIPDVFFSVIGKLIR